MKKRSAKQNPAAVVLLGLGALLLSACGGGMDMAMSPGGSMGGGNVGGGGNLGATTGGAQDFRQVRQQIEQGQVPNADTFLAEGLLAEHDLPLSGKTCGQLLCVQLAAGVAGTRFAPLPDGAGYGPRTTLVQIGLSSGLQAATFRRAPLNLALVVDVSGSMQGDKMKATRDALHALADRLDEGDLVSIVAFNSSASLRLGPTDGGQRAKIGQAIDTLAAGGSTNIEAGLLLGLQQIDAQQDTSRSARVMLFTDAQPNVGATSSGSFGAIIADAARRKIGLTAFGVGIDFNATLIDAIANLRGGNYFYLADAAAIRTVFDKDFDYLVTPLAYDFSLELTIAPGFRFVAAHGVKSWQSGQETTTMQVATVFLSRNKGAMLVELEHDGSALPATAVPILSAKLGYELADGARETDALAVELPAAAFVQRQPSYSQPAVRKAVALVTEVNGMQEACRRYWANDREGARGLLMQIEQLLSDHAKALGDTALSGEVALVAKLRANMM